VKAKECEPTAKSQGRFPGVRCRETARSIGGAQRIRRASLRNQVPVAIAGGAPGQCGWLTDKYGVSWQVAPTALGWMLQDASLERVETVVSAMLRMRRSTSPPWSGPTPKAEGPKSFIVPQR
jgi:hypothetical protein